MKNFSITTAILATILTLSSCQKFLDTDSPSSFEPSIVFADPLLAEAALLGAYDILGENNSYRNRLIHTFCNSDIELQNASIQGIGSNSTRRAIAIYNIRSDNGEINGASNPYTFAYMGIERLNLLIAGIRAHGDLNNAALARVYGEALALRAFYYFDLIRWHGDVPARFEPASGATLRVGRADRDEIYIQILEDLKTATQHLPWPGGSASHNRVYRMNKAFAHAFRARVALHAGGYSLRPIGENGGEMRLSTNPALERKAMYEIAREETAYVIANEGRGFRLENDFERIFRDNMREDASVGRESIFELPYSPGNRGQWLSFYGLRHTGSDRFHDSPSNVKGEAGPSPIMWYWFDDRDLRREVSVAPFRYEGTNSATTATQIIQASSGTPNIRTWFFGKLRAEWGARRMGGNDDGIRPIVMRYADVLLMFAEAQNELEGPTTPHNGLSAQNVLRRVRERAFDDQTAVSTYIANVSASPERFFQAIMDERAFEFLGEQRRNYDLNRWNRLQSEMDWARRQTLRLREGLAVGSGGRLSNIPGDRDIDFSEFPRHIFWRHVPHPTFGADVQILEIFGLRRGEFPRDEGGQSFQLTTNPILRRPNL